MDFLDEILSKSKKIEETTNFDSNNFKKFYLNKNKPVVLKGYGHDWAAKEKWTLDFLADLEVESPVSLEIGANNQKETNFVRENLKTYIESIIKNEYRDKKDIAYLTLFNIFDRFPHLKDDVDLSILTKFTKRNNIYAWIGPEGTITGLHYDSLNNLLAQVMGRKLVVLVAPKDNKNMYISDKFELGATSSEVDINNYDESKHPKFKEVKFFSVVLRPGDVLFIPKKWWHYVKSLDTSISISNFGAFLPDILFTQTFESFLYSLHCRGYYKKGNCTCHRVVDGKVLSKFN
ncbi:cupin-like domain-containing protein [Flavobacteriaceae bacterium SZ-1-7]|uniref:cupin-like domain-containing protein n=1 Tax=Tamlana sedimenti TaxID=3134126 RepID=UPI00312917A8